MNFPTWQPFYEREFQVHLEKCHNNEAIAKASNACCIKIYVQLMLKHNKTNTSSLLSHIWPDSTSDIEIGVL